MLIPDKIADLIGQAILAAQEKSEFPTFDLPKIVVERPKDPNHGDYATPVALSLKKLFGTEKKFNPRAVAEQIVAELGQDPMIGETSIAGPGFINIRLSEAWLDQQVETILAEGDNFGRADLGQGKSIQVEYISANPTGPLVVGSGRNAILGDTLANILEAAGYSVQREYYINDVGTQVTNLGKALYARYLQALGRDEPDPEEYQGYYLVEMGQELVEAVGDKYADIASVETLDFMRQHALEKIIESLKEDTALIGVNFDKWFSEQSLYDTGLYDLAYARLVEQDMTVEREGAIWLKSEDEDDKENVIVRSDGRPTYFASDIAYVWNKLADRGFERAIYVWGADHHGHIKRVKYAAKALGLDPDKVEIVLYQLVTITRDGVPVRQGKRTGNFTTVREVVEEIGMDAFRFMLLTRSADSQMELDLVLATKESNENPVYYVQYSHARTASIFRRANEEGMSVEGGDVALLTHPSELELIRQMLRLSEVVTYAAISLAPHSLTYYAQEVASAFNNFYRDCKVILPEEPELTAARLKLVNAAKITLANTLRLMGMSTPERM